MSVSRYPFLKFILSKENKTYLFITAIIGIVYFIILRSLYPIPSYYSDSFTWIGASVSGQPVSFRPVGYSKLLIFFKWFSTSDIAVIAAQFIFNLLANLLLFYTCTFFFRFKKPNKILLYLLLIVNPFYLFYSNYISSDPFFNCLAVIWFVLLMWILNKPTWSVIIIQLVVLACLFELRYNAIFFPAITMVALLAARQPIWKKAIIIGINFLLVASIILITTLVTKNYTGTKTFSAFSGWQLANDALHIFPHKKIDTTNIKNNKVKHLVRYTIHFFDTAKIKFPDTGATAIYMWERNSPLRKYMQVFPDRSRSYFKTWNTLGPILSEFGKTIILQNPVSYVQYFVLPNTKAYFFPKLEIYETYMEDHDTIAAIAQKFYHYKSKKTPAHHPAVYAAVFNPFKFLFPVLNLAFAVAVLYYLFSKKYLFQSRLFNQSLLCFSALFIINFFFVILLAPTVIRYHVFIITLSFPILLYMLQQLIKPANFSLNDF